MLAVQVLTSEKRANQLSPGGPHAYKNGHVMMNFGSDVIYLLHTHTHMNVCMCILIQMGANLSFSCYGFLANNFVFSHVDITDSQVVHAILFCVLQCLEIYFTSHWFSSLFLFINPLLKIFVSITLYQYIIIF